jgi:Zn-dependent protease
MVSAGYWVAFFVSLLVHEAGHVCAARALGLRVKRVGITWRGPFIVRESGAPMANAIISAAGPLVNSILAALTWPHWPSFALANLVLGITNLLPTKHSDGRRIINELARSKQELAEEPLDTASPGITLGI